MVPELYLQCCMPHPQELLEALRGKISDSLLILPKKMKLVNVLNLSLLVCPNVVKHRKTNLNLFHSLVKSRHTIPVIITSVDIVCSTEKRIHLVSTVFSEHVISFF